MKWLSSRHVDYTITLVTYHKCVLYTCIHDLIASCSIKTPETKVTSKLLDSFLNRWLPELKDMVTQMKEKIDNITKPRRKAFTATG